MSALCLGNGWGARPGEAFARVAGRGSRTGPLTGFADGWGATDGRRSRCIDPVEHRPIPSIECRHNSSIDRRPGLMWTSGARRRVWHRSFRLPAGCRSPAASWRGISPERRNGADEPALGNVGPDRVRMPTSTPSATAAATTSPARSDRTALMEAAAEHVRDLAHVQYHTPDLRSAGPADEDGRGDGGLVEGHDDGSLRACVESRGGLPRCDGLWGYARAAEHPQGGVGVSSKRGIMIDRSERRTVSARSGLMGGPAGTGVAIDASFPRRHFGDGGRTRSRRHRKRAAARAAARVRRQDEGIRTG